MYHIDVYRKVLYQLGHDVKNASEKEIDSLKRMYCVQYGKYYLDNLICRG